MVVSLVLIALTTTVYADSHDECVLCVEEVDLMEDVFARFGIQRGYAIAKIAVKYTMGHRCCIEQRQDVDNNIEYYRLRGKLHRLPKKGRRPLQRLH